MIGEGQFQQARHQFFVAVCPPLVRSLALGPLFVLARVQRFAQALCLIGIQIADQPHGVDLELFQLGQRMRGYVLPFNGPAEHAADRAHFAVDR
ncbi:hypothetical protein D3C84_654180 [compost metagenome]